VTATVAIRLVEAPDSRTPENTGTVIWSSRQPITTLARTLVRAFDTVATEHGEAGYQTLWGRPFPRHELEALRAAWRTTTHPPTAETSGQQDSPMGDVS
jgi:hypothetical protein